VIGDHILRHAHHDKKKTKKEERKINNVIANFREKLLYKSFSCENQGF
jgi:hypothetical protein